MRRLLLLAPLLAAGCATTPQQPRQPSPVAPQPQARGPLLGLSAGQLVQRLGTPALQIREGQGLKLQFRSSSCVLDAYLYRPAGGQGAETVTHVDARARSGADIDPASCVATLQRS